MNREIVVAIDAVPGKLYVAERISTLMHGLDKGDILLCIEASVDTGEGDLMPRMQWSKFMTRLGIIETAGSQLYEI